MVGDLTYRQEIMRVHPVASHRGMLQSYQGLFQHIRSNEVCLACTMRRPARALSCGHSICAGCVRTFGELVAGEQYIYAHPRCVLCYTSLIPPNIQLRPPPSTPRALCVDADGPVVWKALQLLEVSVSQLMGFPFPIRECFDIVFGRGPGAGPIRDLFLHELAIGHCRAQSQCTPSVRLTNPLRLDRTKVGGHMGQPSYIDCYSVPGSGATIATITPCARPGRPEAYHGIQTIRGYIGRLRAARCKGPTPDSGPVRRSMPPTMGHTLNVILPSKQSLDDVSDPHVLDLSVVSAYEVARVLVASHFYFELSRPPQYVDGRYLCNGYIHCRLRVTDQFWFLRALTLSSHRVYIGSVGYMLQMLPRGQRFIKDITFTVGSAEQPISILLGSPFSTGPAQCIGGSPFTIDSLSQLQFS
ncbi:hypothetical protein HOY80DRAFT_689551 [Tuber brumale]|nr:hypothetical protein HOY80DRAFT_689551 [Tuber brumale]